MKRSVFLAVACVVAIVGTVECLADSWEGAWRDTELGGIGLTPDAECEAVALTDRTVRLAKTADGYEGAWLTAHQQRLTLKRKPSCRLQNTKEPNFGLSMKLWMLTGKIDPASGKLKVVGHSGKCTGDWCKDWKEAEESFETTLQLKDGKLVDLGTDSSSATGRSFLPEVTYQQGTQAVANEMRRVGKLMADGSCGEFYDGAASIFRNSRSRSDFVGQCKEIGSKIESRSFQDQLYITSFGKGQWPLRGPYVLFMNRVATKLGLGVEFAVFAPEDGSMRVIYWSVQT